MKYLPLILLLLPLLALLLATLRASSGVSMAGLIAGLQTLSAGLASYFVFIEKETFGESHAWLRIDPLSAFFIFLVSIFALIAINYERTHWSMLPIEAEQSDNHIKLRRLLWLWFAANTIVLAYGLLYMWAGFVLLILCVGYVLQSDHEEAKRFSLHAWIALSLSLIGSVVLFWAIVKTGASENVFSYDSFLSDASALDDSLMIVGASLSLIGYGFFAGLWPGQALLQAAYEKLSAPKAFFYATALWSASMYAVLRVVGLCAKATGIESLHPILLLFGGFTAVASALAMQRESRLKPFFGHLMTYHTGILLFSLGLSSRFTAQAIMFSLFFLSLTRGLLWLSAGTLSTQQQEQEISQLSTNHTGLRWMLALSFAASIGLPPFGTFISQWINLHALAIEHHQWYSNERTSGLLGALWMVALYWRLWLWVACSAIALIALVRVGGELLKKSASEIPTKLPRGVYYAFALLFLLVLMPGLFIPEFIDDLFDQLARQIVGEWSSL